MVVPALLQRWAASEGGDRSPRDRIIALTHGGLPGHPYDTCRDGWRVFLDVIAAIGEAELAASQPDRYIPGIGASSTISIELMPLCTPWIRTVASD